MSDKQTTRIICAWCGKIKDGKGQIPKGAPISHGMCETCEQLFPLSEIYPECTKGWIGEISRELWIMEEWGLTYFGGADVSAYNLVQQAKGRNWLQLNSYYSQLRAERA